MTKIVIADDHKGVRKGLRILFGSEPDFGVVGEAENGLQAVEVVQKLNPDILVLDLAMPGIQGLDVIRLLKKTRPDTSILVLSMYDDEAYVLEALRCGARGYVLKESPPEEILTAAQVLTEGEYFLSPRLRKFLSQNNAQNVMDDTSGTHPRPSSKKDNFDSSVVSHQ